MSNKTDRMNRPEETAPSVMAFAQAIDSHRRELLLTPLEAVVGIKLALEVLVDEAGVVAAPLHSLRQMLDEIESRRCPETFPHRITPYPVEKWKTSVNQG